jgi:hypothetical protein
VVFSFSQIHHRMTNSLIFLFSDVVFRQGSPWTTQASFSGLPCATLPCAARMHVHGSLVGSRPANLAAEPAPPRLACSVEGS